ncbi:MAG: hypothetical protein ACM33B_05875 [Pseudomonadota bacterium]
MEGREAEVAPGPAAAGRSVRVRRIALGAVVAASTATALFAIGVLLLGEFGDTEGRILATTGLLALFGLLALPSGVLLDQGRHPALAATSLALAAAGLALALVTVWTDGSSETVGKLLGSVAAAAAAAAQTAALAARRRARDPVVVQSLFGAATVVAVALVATVTAAIWTDLGSQAVARVLGAGVVLDVLLVALQPLLAVSVATRRPFSLRLRLAGGERTEVTVEAPRLGVAAARAIDAAERSGRTVVAVELVDAEPLRPAVVGEIAGADGRSDTDEPAAVPGDAHVHGNGAER